MSSINDILKSKNTTILDISIKTDSPYSSLYNSSRNDVSNWKISTLNTFAKGLNMNAGELLNLLQESDLPEIKFDDSKLELQGYIFSKEQKDLYFYMKKVITDSAIQGFIPTKEEIESLILSLSDNKSNLYTKWRSNWKNNLFMKLKTFQESKK